MDVAIFFVKILLSLVSFLKPFSGYVSQSCCFREAVWESLSHLPKLKSKGVRLSKIVLMLVLVVGRAIGYVKNAWTFQLKATK